MNEPKVSVIIPVYNCNAYVNRAISSILNQSYRNLELLVADDASTDGSLDLLNRFDDERIVFSHNKQNQGYLRTVNRLLQECSGDYITFQDADDWSHPERIRLQLGHLRDRTLQVCGTAIYNTANNGKVTGSIIYPANSDAIARNVMNGLSSVCYATLMFSREILHEIGGYREFFRYGAEDVDWLLRITERYQCENLQTPLYYYRFSPDSITGSLNILRQIASIRFARELALQRRNDGLDLLQRGEADLATTRLDALHAALQGEALAEETFRFNQLVRKKAYKQALGIVGVILRRNIPLRRRLAAIISCLLKLAFGVDRYRSISRRLARRETHATW